MALFQRNNFWNHARHFSRAMILCASMLVVQNAHAALTVTLTEVARMDWATLGIPASGSATVILHPSNTSPSGTGTVLYGMPNRGQYKLVLSGSGPETSMSLDISSINSGSGSLTLSNFTGIYNSTGINSFPSGTLALPAAGAGTQLYLGATATVNAGQSPAHLSPSFDIDIILN